MYLFIYLFIQSSPSALQTYSLLHQQLLAQMSSSGYYPRQRWVILQHITPNECQGSHCAAVVREGTAAVGLISVTQLAQGYY